MSLDHKHFIINCNVHKPLAEVETTKDWLTRLVDAIEMKIVAGPIAHYCEAEGNNGITGAVCIATSHCSIHVWDQVEEPYMRLDIYSCAAFDSDKVIEMLNEFEPHNINYIMLDRNKEIRVI